MQFLFLISICPFVFLAYGLARRFSSTTNFFELAARILPICFSLILIFVGLFGRILGQLDLGLLWGSGLCLIAGVVFWSKTSQPRDRLHFSLTLKLFDLPLLIIIFGSTFLIALVAFKYAFHDEMNIQSHAPVIESMLRGEFPPSYIAFPEVSFKYHYGFDLLAAVFCLVTGLPGFLGIDGIALTSWISLLAILIVFLKSLGVPRQTWGIALAFIVLSGGWAWWLASGEPGGRGASFQVPQWQEMFLFGRFIHPQIISYFFQHPMGMGLPLFFGALVYFNDFFSEERRGSLLVGSLILGALSLTQVVLFVTLLASLGMVFLWKLASEKGKRKENFLNGLAILFLTVLLALGLGGFFQFSENYQGNALLFSWPPGYLRHEYWGSRFPLSFSQALIWYLSSFGVVLIIAPIAWFLTFRRKNPTLWVLACFGILGFLIPQFLRYQFSWDIIKWLFGFDFSSRVLIACLILPWVSKRVATQVLVWGFVLLGMVSPVRYLGELGFKDHAQMNVAERRIAENPQPWIEGDFQRIIQSMNDCPACRGMTWSTPSLSTWIAIHTGLPMVQMRRTTRTMPLNRRLIFQRDQELKILATVPTLDLLESLRVRWIVFSCGEFNGLPKVVQSFIQSLPEKIGAKDLSAPGSPRDCYKAYLLPESN